MKQINKITLDDVQPFFVDKKIGNLHELTGGNSGAQMVKFKVGNKVYVARRSGGIIGAAAIKQEFSIQKQAAEFGIAPPVIGINFDSDLLIMEYIESILPPLSVPHPKLKEPIQRDQILDLLNKLHSMPLPNIEIKQVNHINTIKAFRSSIPAAFLPQDIEKELDRITLMTWPKNLSSIVHMDFHYRNLLYTGSKFYVIDWEMAGLAHPFVDVSDLANSNFCTQAEGHEMLSLYLKRPADNQEIIIFNELRQIILGFRAIFAFFHAYKQGFIYDDNTQALLDKLPWKNLEQTYSLLDSNQFDASCGLNWFQLGFVFMQELEHLNNENHSA